MRKIFTALLMGAMLAGGAAITPAVADDWAKERYERDRERLDRRYERRERWRDRPDRNRRYDRDYGYYGRGYGDYRACGAFCSSRGFHDLHDGLRRDPLMVEWVRRNFDSNSNGLLSVNEGRRANAVFFRLADRNRNGRVGDDELRAARNRIARGIDDGHRY